MTRSASLPLRTIRPGRALRALVAGLGALAMLSLAVTMVHASESCMLETGKLRFEDRTDCFRDPANRTGWPGALKFIPLDDHGALSLSLGGEVRQRYEFTHNPAFGADPQDESGVWLQRLTLHGDLRLGDHVRLFGQLYSALQEGRAGGPSPVDENQLGLQNAFVEVNLPIDGAAMMARFGRQEMTFGSGRLIDVREGPNNRRTFDAGRLGLGLPGWQIDAFVGRPVAQAKGVFDDQTNDQQSVWGLYATGAAVLPLGALDLYYIGFRDDAGTFVQGTAREQRHSIGLRAFGAHDGWDWNWEAIGQFGQFGQGDIRAWTVATDTGFTFQHTPWQPRAGLSVNIASGDGDPADRDLGTFNPLFPRGNYFSEAAVLGPRNFFNVQPSVGANPTEAWSLTAATNLFWRLNTSDGVYTPSGQLLRAPGGGSDRYVGTALSLSTGYQIAPGLDAGAIYTRFFTGDFLKASGPSQDIDFVEVTLQYKF